MSIKPDAKPLEVKQKLADTIDLLKNLEEMKVHPSDCKDEIELAEENFMDAYAWLAKYEQKTEETKLWLKKFKEDLDNG